MHYFSVYTLYGRHNSYIVFRWRVYFLIFFRGRTHVQRIKTLYQNCKFSGKKNWIKRKYSISQSVWGSVGMSYSLVKKQAPWLAHRSWFIYILLYKEQKWDSQKKKKEIFCAHGKWWWWWFIILFMTLQRQYEKTPYMKTKNEKNAKLHKHFFSHHIELGKDCFVSVFELPKTVLFIPNLPSKQRACMHKDCLRT